MFGPVDVRTEMKLVHSVAIQSGVKSDHFLKFIFQWNRYNFLHIYIYLYIYILYIFFCQKVTRSPMPRCSLFINFFYDNALLITISLITIIVL